MTLYSRQSVLLKSLFVLYLLILTIFASLPQAGMLLALVVALCLPTPRLLGKWLLMLVRLAPLFIALFALGLLAVGGFPVQALLAVRIVLLLLLSVWLARTSRLEHLVAELHPLRGLPLVHDGLWYLVGTLLWLPVIAQELRQRREQARSARAIPALLVDALGAAMQRMDEIEANTEAALTRGSRQRPHDAANLLLLPPACAALAIVLYL